MMDGNNESMFWDDVAALSPTTRRMRLIWKLEDIVFYPIDNLMVSLYHRLFGTGAEEFKWDAYELADRLEAE